MSRTGRMRFGLMLLSLLASCSSGSYQSARLRVIPASATAARPAQTPASPPEQPPVAAPDHTRHAPAPAPPGPTKPALLTAPGQADQASTDWIPLAVWVQTNRCGGLQRLLGTTNLTCEVFTALGPLRLAAGSHMAQLDGVSYALGFPPVPLNGGLLVHELDARKNLLPLLSPIPTRFPAHPVVVIDPGHGGENLGTRGIVPEALEKNFTLDWALRLSPRLADHGWEVVLTRTNDVEVSLAERVAIAERAQADLFISLHFNSAFPREDQNGIETYCLTPTGLPSTLTRDFEDDLTRQFPNNNFDDENLRLAFLIHRAVLDQTGARDRGVRRARFMTVLRGQNRPAVLLEAGYLSNPREASLIATPAYREKLAAAVANALLEPSLRPPVLSAKPEGIPAL